MSEGVVTGLRISCSEQQVGQSIVCHHQRAQMLELGRFSKRPQLVVGKISVRSVAY